MGKLHPFRYHLSFYTSPPSYCLIDQKENYGLLNYYNYEIVTGFYYSENGYHWIKDRISKLRIKVPRKKNMIIIPFEYPFVLFERQQEFSFDVVLSYDNLTTSTNIKFENNHFGEIRLSLTPQDKECIVNVEFNLPSLFHKYNSKDSRLFGVRLNMNSLTVK